MVRAVVAHAFHYDASQGGTTFVDPDGDALTYSVSVQSWGVAASGPWITHTPATLAGAYAVITARDGRGGEATDSFVIAVAENSPPTVALPNSGLLTTLGEHVNRDLTQGGRTFADPDGDTVAYAAEMIAPPGRGFSLDSLRAVGALANAKMVAFRITATDGFGGSASDTFVVAAPDPLPGEPTLPTKPYAYVDNELPLPWVFRRSRIELRPFWDTLTTQGTPISNAGATLGRVLFYDKRLSILNTHSCGSCHEQARGFTTGDRFPVGVLGVPLKRNALPITNSRFNLLEKYFIDLRSFNLDHLVLLPIADPTELGQPLDMAVPKIEATPFYRPLFDAAFGPGAAINSESIKAALTQFIRATITYRSRFDQAYLKQDELSPPPDAAQFLTPIELDGAKLFNETLPCSQCHTTELQTLDQPTNNGLDVVSVDRGANGIFRTASLRNIAQTAPYMHDGRFATLREVIDHYDSGIQDAPELDPLLRENGVGAPLRLHLTNQEKDALEAFLRVLTDDALLTDPKFSDPFQ